LKKLTVEILVVDARGRSASHTTFVNVRDRSQFLTNDVDPANKPLVSFLSLTPPEGSVVWGAEWGDPDSPSPLYIDVEAQAADGLLIDNVDVTFFEALKCEATDGRPASWQPLVASWSSSSELFVWNTEQTTQKYDDDGNVIGDVPVVPDGWRELRVSVVSKLATGEATTVLTRYLLVDNLDPPVPSPSVTSIRARGASVSWSKVIDGTTGADSYHVEWVPQPMGATNGDIGPFDEAQGWGTPLEYRWLDASEHDGGFAHPITTEPFSRYATRVQAVSPEPLKRESGWSAEVVFVSRPLLTGTYTVAKKSTGNPQYWRVTANLNVTPAALPTAGTPTYKFERLDGATWVPLQNGTSTSLTDTVEFDGNPKDSDFPKRSYRVTATYTPVGHAGDSEPPKTISSNTVSTALQPAGGPYTLTEGTW
jgi:hypothetical protein